LLKTLIVLFYTINRRGTDPLIKASLNAEESYNIFARDAGSIGRLIIEVRE
jgi:hypothetical protein